MAMRDYTQCGGVGRCLLHGVKFSAVLMTGMIFTGGFVGGSTLAYAENTQHSVDTLRKDFDIPKKDLASALKDVFLETNTETLYAPGLVEGKSTNGLKGRYSLGEALDILLEGSGLTYEIGKDKTLLIREVESDKTSQLKPELHSVYEFAQADQQGQEQVPAVRQEEKEEQKRDKELAEFEEIVVTGSHIRGVGLSVGSKVEIIDRLEIDRSGFATTQQILQSLPQNFGGGANERVTNSANLTAGTGVNLRGLGTDSTLLLVNGRRVPVAGLNTDFFDVSNIPTTAIERIEVLSDGASAIYGTDAIAGVINIILRDDYEGAETRARFGTVTEGGQQEYQFSQTFGTNWESGNALISYEYYNRDSLGNEEREFTADSDLRSLGGDNFSTTFSNPGNIADPFTGFSTVAFAIPAGQDGTALTPGDLMPGSTRARSHQIDSF